MERKVTEIINQSFIYFVVHFLSVDLSINLLIVVALSSLIFFR